MVTCSIPGCTYVVSFVSLARLELWDLILLLHCNNETNQFPPISPSGETEIADAYRVKTQLEVEIKDPQF